MIRIRHLLAVLALAAGSVLLAPAHGAELSGYTIGELLEPCVEGDNDSRWGAAAEAECEQYIKGFTDAYLMLVKDPKAQGVCLPVSDNRQDEVRWAFMRWAHQNYGDRGKDAADGLLAAMKSAFACKK